MAITPQKAQELLHRLMRHPGYFRDKNQEATRMFSRLAALAYPRSDPLVYKDDWTYVRPDDNDDRPGVPGPR